MFTLTTSGRAARTKRDHSADSQRQDSPTLVTKETPLLPVPCVRRPSRVSPRAAGIITVSSITRSDPIKIFPTLIQGAHDVGHAMRQYRPYRGPICQRCERQTVYNGGEEFAKVIAWQSGRGLLGTRNDATYEFVINKVTRLHSIQINPNPAMRLVDTIFYKWVHWGFAIFPPVCRDPAPFTSNIRITLHTDIQSSFPWMFHLGNRRWSMIPSADRFPYTYSVLPIQ